VLAQLILLAAIGLVPRRLGNLPPWPDAFARWGSLLGGGMLALGGVLGAAAAVQLGSNLTPFPRPKEDATLVRRGAYGLTRHPIYTSLLLLAFGWSLLRANTPALVLALLLIFFFDQKARREEAWLLERFPDYAGYCRRVRKLIPWLY
jgi:protein-S-isoprenylcysteine O-methyltransferase Ste14